VFALVCLPVQDQRRAGTTARAKRVVIWPVTVAMRVALHPPIACSRTNRKSGRPDSNRRPPVPNQARYQLRYAPRCSGRTQLRRSQSMGVQFEFSGCRRHPAWRCRRSVEVARWTASRNRPASIAHCEESTNLKSFVKPVDRAMTKTLGAARAGNHGTVNPLCEHL
jgi:hypothetical protein